MAREPKKYLLTKQCDELGISYNTRTTMKELEKLIKEKEEELENITPYEYFQQVKDSIKRMGNEDLEKMYTASSSLMEKYKETGQAKAEKKLAFHIKTLLKESSLLELGINRFVYKDDIVDYIDNISKKPVKIIEMKNYPREIPDELVDTIKATKDIFDEFYVVFTDYSGDELINEVEKERDPILFGGFCTKGREIVAERFYYLGDWVDEYCDLTLDKLIDETSKDVVKTISIPTNKSQLISQLASYEENENGTFTMSRNVKEPFFKRIINAIKGK